MAQTQKSTLSAGIEAVLEEIRVGTTKSAAVKSANPISEPGEHSGQSSHPTAKAEDGLQDAKEGFRSSENSADEKKRPQGSMSPDSVPEVGDRQDEVQPNKGTSQSSTGEDPSVEDDYKGDKDDPGTSHPAKTDDGEKYGSWTLTKLASAFKEVANDVLADVANGRLNKQAASTAPTSTGAAAPGKSPPASTKSAAEAGYEAAAMLGQNDLSEDDLAQAFVAQTIKEAHLAADLTANYLAEFAKAKQAADDGASEGEDHDKPGDEDSGASEAGSSDKGSSGGTGAPAEGGASSGAPPAATGAPAGDPLAAMAGGGAPAMDPMAAGGGGDPLAAGGGAPMGGAPMGGGMGGGPMGGAPDTMGGLADMAPAGPGAGQQELLMQLIAALLENGQGADQLGAMGQKAAGTKYASIDFRTLADQVNAFRKAGKFEFRAPANNKQAQMRADCRRMLAELS
jgi:hypothetical protein